MTNTKSPLASSLEHSLESGHMSSDARAWGETLLGRLKAPVQIVVMGKPGSGKSALINMLTGISAIPSLDDLPVVEVAGGGSHRVVFELEDGSIMTSPGTLDNVAVPGGTVRARQELPEEALKTHNFIEINLTGGAAQRAAILEWAVERANVVLWCTEHFDVSEQQIWAGVPDDLKDHSFLVLTKADRQLMKGVLPQQIAALEDMVSEEFLSLYPVATIQAIAAQSSEQRENTSLWKSSGGKALRDAVMHQVETGRAADIDQASLFLSRFAPDQVVDIPLPDAPKQSRAVAVAKPDPMVTPPVDGKNVKLMDDAFKLLQSHADQMLNSLSDEESPDADHILEQCVQAANALSDIMTRANPNDSTTEEMRDDAQESAEMMLLFQLERSEDAAADAVTLLLQLKKEVAERSVG